MGLLSCYIYGAIQNFYEVIRYLNGEMVFMKLSLENFMGLLVETFEGVIRILHEFIRIVDEIISSKF